MKLMVSLIAVAGFAATIMTVTPATQVKADEYFIPKGHLYTPKADALPPQFSRQADIISRTDVIETEIYRKKQEDRAFFEHFRTFIDRDLYFSGRSYSDY